MFMHGDRNRIVSKHFPKVYEIVKRIGHIIGERQMPQALEKLHDGAVYFLSGQRYQIYKLHLDDQNHTERGAIRREAHSPYAELISLPGDYPYYTRAVVVEWPTILQPR
jgi:DEAD/DEAH box helicase domain-containing protein